MLQDWDLAANYFSDSSPRRCHFTRACRKEEGINTFNDISFVHGTTKRDGLAARNHSRRVHFPKISSAAPKRGEGKQRNIIDRVGGLGGGHTYSQSGGCPNVQFPVAKPGYIGCAKWQSRWQTPDLMLVPKPLLHSTGIQVSCDPLPQHRLSGLSERLRHKGGACVLQAALTVSELSSLCMTCTNIDRYMDIHLHTDTDLRVYTFIHIYSYIHTYT